jgi:hypothetical protein
VVGPSWESLVERQIREAMESGAFADLPHQGRPIPLDDDTVAGEWAMAFRMLKDAGVAPPWIEADKEARARLVALETVIARAAGSRPGRDRARRLADVRRAVSAANEAIGRLNAEAPTVRQHRRLLDVDDILARLA